MAKQPRRRGTAEAAHRLRKRAAALRGRGLSFAAIGRRLGVSKEAAWHQLTKAPAGYTEGARCAACLAFVTKLRGSDKTPGSCRYVQVSREFSQGLGISPHFGAMMYQSTASKFTQHPGAGASPSRLYPCGWMPLRHTQLPWTPTTTGH
jgi:hypothetical protein